MFREHVNHVYMFKPRRVFESVEHPPFVELSINQNGAEACPDCAHGSDAGCDC